MAKSHRRMDALAGRVSILYLIEELTLFTFSPYDNDPAAGSNCTVQKLILGTYTSNDEQNYLQIVSVSVV